MSSASPKRNRSKVQKKGSHGGSRDGAGRKPSSSKLAVAAKGTFTLHTMGFKKADDEADDGTTTSGLIKSSILTNLARLHVVDVCLVQMSYQTY